MKCKSCNLEGFKNPREIVVHKKECRGLVMEVPSKSLDKAKRIIHLPDGTQYVEPVGEVKPEFIKLGEMEMFTEEKLPIKVIPSELDNMEVEPLLLATEVPLVEKLETVLEPDARPTVNLEVEALIEDRWQKQLEVPTVAEVKMLDADAIPAEKWRPLSSEIEPNITERLQAIFEALKTAESKSAVGRLLADPDSKNWTTWDALPILIRNVQDGDERAIIRQYLR